MTHDQLQSKCFQWMWNSYPELRQLFHCNLNNLTDYHSSKAAQVRRMAQMKALGHCIKGRMDFEFYFGGQLHVMDFKVGKDKLSKEQCEYMRQTIAQGGTGREIRSLEEFQGVIHQILKR